MGILPSKDTRRISFDNTFACTAVAVPNAIESENILSFDASDSPEEFISEPIKHIETTEEGVEGDYWSHRIENLKKEHQIINKIIEVEYNKQIESAGNLYTSLEVTQERMDKLKPCFEWREKIMKCYDENPHQPLVCSPIVQAFSTCVASYRLDE